MTGALPPGFELDEAPAAALPEGFVVDPAPRIGSKAFVMEGARNLRESLERGEAGLSFPGVGRGLTSVRDAGSQLIGRGLTAVTPEGVVKDWLREQTQIVEDRNKRVEDEYQASRGDQQGKFDTGRLVGNVLGTLPFGGPTGTTLLGKAAGNALTGAGVSAVSQPVYDTENFWSEKGKQTALGAGGGAVMTPLTAAAARIAAPKAMDNPHVQKLREEGVRLTPGQILGGAPRTVENKTAGTIPIIGDLAANRQRAGTEDLNRAAINRALAPINQKLPDKIDVGREGVAYAQDTLSRAYQDVLAKMPQIKLDPQFLQDFAKLNQAVKTLPADLQGVVGSYVQNNMAPRLAPVKSPWGPSTGVMDGTAMKAIDSELGALIKGYASSSDAGQRELAKHLRDLKGLIFDMAARNYPDQAAALKKIDTGWGNLAVVETAASTAGAKDGIFSANQLASAVKRNDPSVRDRSYAAGRARMQDLSDAASSVMPSNVPDSGTAGRAMLGILGGGGALGGLSHVSPEAAILGGGAGTLASLAYSPAGRWMLEQMMLGGQSWRQPLARGLLDATPALGAGAATAVAPRLGLLQ